MRGGMLRCVEVDVDGGCQSYVVLSCGGALLRLRSRKRARLKTDDDMVSVKSALGLGAFTAEAKLMLKKCLSSSFP